MGRKVWVPVVSGPLAPYAAGFESWLASRAYSPSAAADRLCQLDQLSRWLEREGLARRRADCRAGRAVRRGASRGGLGDVGLAAERGAAARVSARAGGGAGAGAGWSRGPARGAAGGVPPVSAGRARAVRAHGARCVWAGRAAVPGRAGGSGRARAGAAVRGGRELVPGRASARSAACRARGIWSCALRSFLRYLHLAGLIDAPLVWAVPSVADLRDRTLPRGLEPAAVKQAVGQLRSAHAGRPARLRDPAVAVAAGAARRRGRRDPAR